MSPKSEHLVFDKAPTVEHIMPQNWQTNWPLADGTRDTLKKAETATVGTAKLLIFRDLESAAPNFSVFP